MNASSLEQQQHHIKTQATSNSATTGAASGPLSSASDPQTLVLLVDPTMPPTQPAAAVAGASLELPTVNITTAAARPTPTFAGSGLFTAAQDPSKHLAQLPIETPYFTPQAAWTESRSDYFSSAATTPAPPGSGRIISPNPSQASLYTSGFSLPAQTPAPIEISSFSASSPSYFPSPTNPHKDLESQGFNLSPSTPFNRPNAAQGSSASIPALRTNLPISMPLSSLMSPPGSIQAKRLSMSVAAPAELNLKKMTGDMVSQLLGQVLKAEGGNRTAVMLLDMRPSVSHTASSIKTAVSVCVPNMLLKRPMYSLQMVTEQLTTEQDVETFSKWKQFSNIVLFDAAGAAPLVGSPTFFMAQKFRKEGCSANLAYLQGGFNEFSVQYNEFCRSDGRHASGGSPSQRLSMGDLSSSAPTHTLSNPMSIVSPPRQRLHLGSLPSMLTQPPGPLGCQTPMIENPNVNPLFESVRQAMGLSTNITEEIPVRLPMGFSVNTMQEHLPDWLLSAVTEESGKTRLAEYFQKVEINENKRLALLMLPHNMRSGRTTNFSIGAGIEQGLKNRYNNIWPYDHTRVKIGDVEPGHDDYINASMLTPPLSKKSYIATQGPLPSTFQDFWKATWEQNARVVVMLTREQEMGRIKCHQYWPTAQHPVMNVGTMRVTFVTEFLPDSAIGTILVRQLKLQHLQRPGDEVRGITHIQYTGWPDFGVPETPLEVLRVIQLANEHNTPTTAGPMVVHCSAGCGRTGAFCVIDSILTELNERPETVLQGVAGNRMSLSSKSSLEFSLSGNDRVASAMANNSGGSGLSLKSQVPVSTGAGTGVADDPMLDIVFASVSQFREQRISMVQTLRQYVFCYEAIFWHLAMKFAEEWPALGLMVVPPPSMAVHTPLLTMPPNSINDVTMTSNPALSAMNAPITTTSEEFSFFG